MSKFVLLTFTVIVFCAHAVPVPQSWNFGLPPWNNPLHFMPPSFSNFQHLSQPGFGTVVTSNGGAAMSGTGGGFISSFGTGTGSGYHSFVVSSQSDGDKIKYHVYENNNGQKSEKDLEEKLSKI